MNFFAESWNPVWLILTGILPNFCRIFKSNFDYFSALWNWSNSAEFFADFQTQFRSIVSRWNLLNFPRWSETSFSLKVSNSSWISLHFLGINKFCFIQFSGLRGQITKGRLQQNIQSIFLQFLIDCCPIFWQISSLFSEDCQISLFLFTIKSFKLILSLFFRLLSTGT